MQKHKKVKYAAKEFNVSRSAFYGWLKHYKIKLERKIGVPKSRPSLNKLMHLKYKNKKTLKEMSCMFNVTTQTIRRWLKDKSTCFNGI
jgi:transposase